MVFSSVSFLFFFLPIFMASYFLAPTIRSKNLVTLAFSLVFYAWGEPVFVFGLLASIAINFTAARIIDGAEGPRRRLALIAAVTVNLVVLAVFKYATFLVGSANWALASFHLGLPVPKIALPLGISFFTFHCISYVTDVYRRRFRANRNLVQVALYISLFPQLVAGPIVRYSTVARQLSERRHTMARASAGARIFVLGLAQKVLIADQVASLADVVFSHGAHPSLLASWTGLFAYTMQIYFDFAGYSNMAIGLGICLGFTLPRNFRMPYTARSITDFWRRWHMSLSSWLRDYLYIPLGGSRRGAARTYRNLVTVFLLCGLWHGASWNFVLWGVWHGLFLVIERIGLGRLLKRLPRAAETGYTVLVVMLGWVLFRAPDFEVAADVYRGLIGLNGLAGVSFDLHLALEPLTVGALGIAAVLAFVPRWPSLMPALRPRGGGLLAQSGAIAIAAVDTGVVLVLLLLAMTAVAAGTYSPFLYFRF